MVAVHVARPRWVSIFFVLAFIALVAWPLVGIALSAVFYPASLSTQAVFAAIGTVIWVIVIGMNYTSARSEAKHLERLIRDALA